MKVYLQTRLTPMMAVYDSEAEPSEIGTAIRGFLSPYIVLTDNEGYILYDYGEKTESLFPLLIIGGSILTALVILLR